ncbi:maleylpyruvate isomerase family mycothiol-dependent enzyme [Actinoplanes sp. NPDC051343]|uniref:maleylpyruvate isomerase family mycothiol-dependent enzyme n=1 Tax=Actinoplanes sp. NPDC051343 TaxID=3363906 RepID=UPI0037B00D17
MAMFPESVSERTGLAGGPEGLRQAMGLLRRRLIALLAHLPEQEWEHASRCVGWSIHDVARHVRDVALIHTSRLAGRRRPFGDEPFDPRSSPSRWLQHTAGEPASQTMDDLGRLAREEDDLFGSRIEEPPDRLWTSPLGRKVHWSVFSLHLYWDAWLHEADIAVALGIPIHRTDLDLQMAILYALLSAAAPTARTGEYLDASIALIDSPSDCYLISHVGDDVTINARPGSPGSLQADASELIDSLAGRGRDLADILAGPRDVVKQLGLLRALGT